MVKEPSKYVQAFSNNKEAPAEKSTVETPQSKKEEAAADKIETDAPVETVKVEDKKIDTSAADNNAEDTTAKPKDTVETVDEEVKVLEFLNKKNGTNYTSLDEFTKSKEAAPAEVEVETDAELSMFAKFKKEHGGTMKDYLALQQDWNEVGDLEVLRNKERTEGGIELNDADADILIKKKYGLDEDADLDDLSKADELAIRRDAGKYRKEKTASQQEVLKSLETTEEKPKDKSDGPVGETVKLSNGQEVNKDEYLKMRAEYEEARTKAVETLDNFETSFTFKDSNGEHKIDITLPYEEKDKHSMLSLTEDTGVLMQKLKFVDADGNMDHRAFNEGAFWANPETREPFLKKMISNVFSKGVDAQLKQERNVNFDKKTTPPVKSEEKKNEIDYSKLPNANGQRPKYSFNR